MSAPPLRLRISASPLLAGALASAHGAAIGCSVAFLPGWWMPCVASLAIATNLIYHMRRDALQLAGNAVTELLLHDGGECELTLLNGDALIGNIEGSTFVAPVLIVINFRLLPPGRRRTAVLLPDSAPAQDLRRARVWLRYRVRPDLPASGPL